MHTSISKVIVALSVLLLVGACSSGAGASTGASDDAAKPTISDAWMRLPMGADRPAAAYLTIVGGDEADALIAASSPISMDVQVHETTESADGMGMQEVDKLAIPAGGTVTLEPGGHHIMFMMPDMEGVAVGDTVEITLTFERAGDVVVQAEVRAG